MNNIADTIKQLEDREAAYAELLGEIIATFSIERNREMISKWEHGHLLLGHADRWTDRYERIKGPQCTDTSANWCPIHGDCCCKNPEEAKADDECPLHSPLSQHGQGGDGT